MTAIQLSPSQQKAVDQFRAFLMDPAQSEMVISGFAGSGKSFLVKYLRDVTAAQLKVMTALNKEDNLSIKYTATTNKAASVLQSFLHEPVSTIHHLLGLKVENNFRNGKTLLKSTNRTQELGRTLIFVDEASMVDTDLLGWIRICKTRGKTKVVFIGDRYQLAPVSTGYSAVFRYPTNIVHLVEIQRQAAGSPIIQTSQLYRSLLDNGLPSCWPALQHQAPAINLVTGSQFQQLVDNKFSRKHEPNDLKILAWTNDRVIAYNKHVRRLYTSDPNFIRGETVVTNNPIMSDSHIIYGTDTPVKITDVIPNTTDGVSGFILEINQGVRAFMPADWAVARKRMKHYAKNKDWSNYFTIKDRWLDLRPLHAQTVHKAQGSTYKEVFIDMTDIGKNKKWQEVARLMYVAISRASEAVYLYGDLPMRNWSNRDAI